MVHGEHQLRHRRRRHRLHEARSRTDDARVLRFGADHEPRHVLDEQERDPLPVGVLDEVSHLLGALCLHDLTDQWTAHLTPPSMPLSIYHTTPIRYPTTC